MALREVHHRVKNNLQVMQSLLNLEASRARNPEIVRIVRVLQDRLRAVALVHDQLHRSSDVREVHLRAYVASVVEGVAQSHDLSGRAIAMQVRASHAILDMNDALRVGLILNELVSNAATHGFRDDRRGRVTVSVSVGARRTVRIKVGNTGAPLPVNFRPPTDRLGLAIVGNIARNSGGRFWWRRRPNVSFLVELKLS